MRYDRCFIEQYRNWWHQEDQACMPVGKIWENHEATCDPIPSCHTVLFECHIGIVFSIMPHCVVRVPCRQPVCCHLRWHKTLGPPGWQLHGSWSLWLVLEPCLKHENNNWRVTGQFFSICYVWILLSKNVMSLSVVNSNLWLYQPSHPRSWFPTSYACLALVWMVALCLTCLIKHLKFANVKSCKKLNIANRIRTMQIGAKMNFQNF